MSKKRSYRFFPNEKFYLCVVVVVLILIGFVVTVIDWNYEFPSYEPEINTVALHNAKNWINEAFSSNGIDTIPKLPSSAEKGMNMAYHIELRPVFGESYDNTDFREYTNIKKDFPDPSKPHSEYYGKYGYVVEIRCPKAESFIDLTLAYGKEEIYFYPAYDDDMDVRGYVWYFEHNHEVYILALSHTEMWE